MQLLSRMVDCTNHCISVMKCTSCLLAHDENEHLMDVSIYLPLGCRSELKLTQLTASKYQIYQISALSKSCYYHIRELRCLRPYLDFTTVSTIATSTIHSKLDYCNSLYCNLLQSRIKKTPEHPELPCSCCHQNTKIFSSHHFCT